MNTKKQFVNLDELASGKLPHRLLEAVSRTEVSIEEVLEWEESKPNSRITLIDGELRVKVDMRCKLKKLHVVIGSVVGFVWVVVEFVAPYFT